MARAGKCWATFPTRRAPTASRSSPRRITASRPTAATRPTPCSTPRASPASWPLAPCEGPTGIAYDRAANRIFSGCGKTSVVIDPASGKVVAKIANGDGVDALGWDASQQLIYIPAGRDSNVTVVHADSPDHYSVLATVPTMRGAKTITVDPVRHVAYLFQPE